MFRIVPNTLSEKLYQMIDDQLEKMPELKKDRENIYHDLLNYYDEHGVIPDFKIEPKIK